MKPIEENKNSLPDNAFRELKEGEEYVPLMKPEEKHREVTAWSVTWGIIMAIVFSAATAYLGLKVGQVFEAAIPLSLIHILHETILEVNLNAVVENLNYYRSFLKPETKITCMIKASAYGSGSIEIAKTLQDRGVDYMAVAVADEGVSLREAGITGDIIKMCIRDST